MDNFYQSILDAIEAKRQQEIALLQELFYNDERALSVYQDRMRGIQQRYEAKVAQS